MATDPTNLVEGDDTSLEDTEAPDAGVDQQEEIEAEPETDEDGNPIEPEPEEDEEVDLDDIKLKVPKDVAQKVREGFLRQADYTKKTQEAAELRKALEADRNNLRDTSDAELGAAAQATAINQRIGYLDQVAQQNGGWSAWVRDDPFAASEADMERRQLERAGQQALGQLHHLRNQRVSQAQQETAKRIEEGRKSLPTHIPEWNDDLKAKLIGFAVGFGFSRDDLDDLEADPRVARVLHAAFTGSEATRKAAQAQRHVTAQQAQPAAKAKGSTAPPTGLVDRLPTDEWMKRRTAQVRKGQG